MSTTSVGPVEIEAASSPAATVPAPGLAKDPPHQHGVHFYTEDAELCAILTDFVAAGLAAGEGVLLVATAGHRAGVFDRLCERGVEVELAMASGRLEVLDPEHLLTRFMVSGMPDAGLFASSVGELLRARTAMFPRVRVFGEMVDLLWRAGNGAGAIRLEELWNELQRKHSFELLCAYAMESFYRAPAELRAVCAQHSAVHGNGNGRASLASGGSTKSGAEASHALLHEIAQRTRAEAALRDSLLELRAQEERLRLSLEAGQMGDWEWEIGSGQVTWSGALEDIHGIPRGSFGGTYEDYRRRLHPEDEAGVVAAIERTLARPGGKHYAEYRIVRGDGEVRWLETHGRLESDADGKPVRLVGICTDITDRKRTEYAREEANRRNERLVRITAAIADSITAEQVYEAVVDQVGGALSASSAGLWLVDEERQKATLVRDRGYHPDARPAMAEVPLDAVGRIPIVDALRTGKPIWIQSQQDLLAEYPHLAGVVSPDRRYRISCLPIVAHGQVIGGLAFTFDDAPPLDSSEQNFLMLVAGYCAQALERLRLFEAERRSRARAEASAQRMGLLSRASRAFTEAGADLPRLLQAIVDEITDEVADACGIVLIPESGGDTLEVAAVYHRDPDARAALHELLASSPPKLGEGIHGVTALTGQSILVPVVDRATFLAQFPEVHREWLGAYLPYTSMAVPLRAQGRILGALSAIRMQAPSFTPDDQSLFQELGERAALAIASTRLQEANRTGRARAELLYDLAAGVIGSERLEDLFQTALDGLESALGAERSSILAFDADGVMRFKAWRGLSDEYRAAVEGHTPWSPDAHNPEPILVTDMEVDPSTEPYRPVFRREGIRALGFIPLVAGGRLIGKFMVYYGAPRTIDGAELAMARAIANHVAAGIARFAAIQELRQTVRFNEMFTGMLGHDLRNPLGGIMTAAQLAVMRGESERIAKPLGRILAAGARMSRMIDHLLDFTRVRVGAGIPIEPRSLQLAPLLRQVIDELDDASPGWTIELDGRGDDWGVWDGDRLSQVFSNLVANAVQHGEVQHGVRVHFDGSDPERVCVEVHNQGSIPATVIPHLFEPLTGGDRRRDRSQGLGLGLFISQQILRAHGGRIDVRSSEAEGTTFIVVLPRAAPEKREA